MADDLAMVARVYELAGQPLDPRARQSMASFMAAHPRGRFGAVNYDLSQFGLDAGDRRRALAFYTERFAVVLESSSHSIGRVAMPVGSRPASTQPMRMATTGMAIRMKNRLSHGTWWMMSETPPSSALERNQPKRPT